MNNVTPINQALVNKVQESQQLLTVDIWQAASDDNKTTALLREQFLQPVLTHVKHGVSVNVAIRNVLQHIQCNNYSPQYIESAFKLGRKGKLPSRATIHNWLKAYREKGREGLLNKFTGRVRKERGWEHLAIQLFNIPGGPAYTAVAQQLRERYGFDDATNSAVIRYLKSLPATLNESSPHRLGKHFHMLNRGRYVERSTDILQVGEIYEGDGHTVDCYVAHPNTGKPYRPELTVWIDVKSKYVTGWWLSDAESSSSTLFALSHALIEHNHVPAWVHVDNGSGFKAKIMSDDSVGYYSRFSIQPTFSIPGNSKGKGLIEGWFRPFRDKHDKFFNGGTDYCGDDMAPEINRKLSIQIERGERQLRSLQEYAASVKEYIERYNQRPQKSLTNKSPADLWATLERVELATPAAAVIRPSELRTARRCTVTIHNRTYEHTALAHYDTRQVEVQFDLHNDDRVWIYDDKKRLICVAPLKTKKAWMPQSRLDEQREKREQGRIGRLQKKIDLVRAEERANIDHNAAINELTELAGEFLDVPVSDDAHDDQIANTIALIDRLED